MTMPFDIADLEKLSEAEDRRLLHLINEEGQRARREWVRRNRPPGLDEFYAAADECYAAAKAYEAGDEGPMEALVESYVGKPLDDKVLRAALEEWLAHGKNTPPVYVVHLLRYHRRRLSTTPVAWYNKRSAEVASGLNKSRKKELIRAIESDIEAIEGVKPSRSKVLTRLEVSEIPPALVEAEARGYYTGFLFRPLLREVDRIITSTNRSLNMVG